MADAGEQSFRGGSIWVGQDSREGSDRRRQRLLLGTSLLVAAVESIGNEFGASSKYPVTETRRDSLGVGIDDGQGLGDDFSPLWGQTALIDIQV